MEVLIWSLVMSNVISRKERSVQLKTGMKVGSEVDVILKFHTATTGDSNYVVDLSLVKLRHKAMYWLVICSSTYPTYPCYHTSNLKIISASQDSQGRASLVDQLFLQRVVLLSEATLNYQMCFID